MVWTYRASASHRKKYQEELAFEKKHHVNEILILNSSKQIKPGKLRCWLPAGAGSSTTSSVAPNA